MPLKAALFWHRTSKVYANSVESKKFKPSFHSNMRNYIFYLSYTRRRWFLFGTQDKRFARKSCTVKNNACFSQNQEKNIISYIQRSSMTSLSSIILANEQELERNFLLFNSISSQGERISYWKPKWSGSVLTEKYIGKSIVRSENFTRIQENYELENYYLRNFHRAASYLVSCTQNCSIKKESLFLAKKRE